MIRKERKARWVYECLPCSILVAGPDHWTVYEAQWHHERSLTHGFKMLAQALQPVLDAYAELARMIVPMAEHMQKDYALVPLPPTLLPPAMPRVVNRTGNAEPVLTRQQWARLDRKRGRQ